MTTEELKKAYDIIAYELLDEYLDTEDKFIVRNRVRDVLKKEVA